MQARIWNKPDHLREGKTPLLIFSYSPQCKTTVTVKGH